MESLIINGGNKLNGQIYVSSAKNAVLPIIACSIMCKEQIILKNCPRISDISSMLNIINSIGGKAHFEGSNIIINCKDADPLRVDTALTKGIRSSVFILGSLITRFKRANICYPGGCEIGKRPIDLHISGLRALNIKVTESSDVISCDGKDIRCGTIHLSLPSVGATENLMMAAVLTKGITTIHNSAKEPEIVDLQNFINHLGGKIHGAGTSTITIEGVQSLHGGEYTPIPDRIVAGTIMAGCGACGGRVKLLNINSSYLESVLDKLSLAGCELSTEQNSISIECHKRLKAINKIETKPFPHFPTDMQAQIMAMLTLADGESVIEENLFENRFKHALELQKMGANIRINDKEAIIRGVNSLNANQVNAMDLRGGAALTIAALAANGTSKVTGLCHIDRGYERIENIFASLGGDIKRISE